MKIAIFASIGAQNLGDELILKNEIKLLEKEFKNNPPLTPPSNQGGEQSDIEFTVFTYDKENTFYKANNVKYREYFPIGIRNPKNILRNIINFFIFLYVVIKSDLIVIGGGGIIYDNELQNTKSPLDSWLFRVKNFDLFKKKYNFFRVGINIKNDNNLTKVKRIFKNANRVEVRDNYSKTILDNLGIASIIEKDPVFFDNKELTEKKSLIGKIDSLKFDVTNLYDFDFNGITVGLAFRSGYLEKASNMANRMEEGKIREIINYIVRSGGKVIMLPHSFHKTDNLANDYIFLEKFCSSPTNRSSWGEQKIYLKDSMVEVYDVYKNKEIDVCLSMRLHSQILCHVYEIPFIGISYSKKTDEILDSLK